LRRFPDRFRDALPFVEDFIVPIPQDRTPVIATIDRALGRTDLCFRVMLATVQLDDQAFFEAEEIDNVFSQRKLKAEFQAFKRPAAKPSPETCLRFGWMPSRFAVWHGSSTHWILTVGAWMVLQTKTAHGSLSKKR